MRGLSFALVVPEISLPAVSVAPKDIIDTDRLWLWPGLLDAVSGTASFPDRKSRWGNLLETGTFSDNVDRCPRLGGSGCEVGGLLALPCTSVICEEMAVFRCRSPNVMEPLAVEVDGMRGAPGVAAMFLNVIWHPTSSPAKTVASDHCT